VGLSAAKTHTFDQTLVKFARLQSRWVHKFFKEKGFNKIKWQ